MIRRYNCRNCSPNLVNDKKLRQRRDKRSSELLRIAILAPWSLQYIANTTDYIGRKGDRHSLYKSRLRIHHREEKLTENLIIITTKYFPDNKRFGEQSMQKLSRVSKSLLLGEVIFTSLKYQLVVTAQ